MRAAAHVDALEAVFSGLAHPITAGLVVTAKVAVTQYILKQYAERLGGNPQFQAWFAAAQTASRINLTSTQNAPTQIKSLKAAAFDYGTASYFSAGNFFVAPSSQSEINIQEFAQLGLLSHCVTTPLKGNLDGDNPVFTINLVNGGALDYHVLERFIAAEDRIVIYDKYVNPISIELIEYVAKRMHSGSSLQVFTSHLGGNCLRSSEIAQRLGNANPKIKSSCLQVSDAFRRLAHDRYLFCGERLQIVFTAGLDCFGPKKSSGKRNNRQSKINVYATGGAGYLSIEAFNGTCCKVRSVSPDLS